MEDERFGITFHDALITVLENIAEAAAVEFVAHRGASHDAPENTLAAIRAAIWEIPLPIIVLGGVYSGYFAVSEAAVVTVVYVFVVEVLIYRDIPIKRLPGVMRDSMVLVGGILIILGANWYPF